MTAAYKEFCQFCFQSFLDVKALIVCEDGETSICDRCAQIALNVAQEHIHAQWLKLKDFAP